MTGSGDTTKMVEEIKLFWTIQIAVGGVLGYLAANLTFGYANVPGGTDASAFLKDATICVVALVPLTVGALYNIVGNYYIRIEGLRLELGAGQGGITTLVLSLMHLAVAAGIGAIAMHSASQIDACWNYSLWWGALAGFGVIYAICVFTHASLWYHAPSDYRGSYQCYTKRLRWVFCLPHLFRWLTYGYWSRR